MELIRSSWYGAVFWSCAGKGVDNMIINFIIGGQCLHSTKAASPPPTSPLASLQGMHKELEEDTARTAYPN